MSEVDGYWCVICGRWLPNVSDLEDERVIIHDDIEHPDITFDEEEHPQ